MAEENTEADAKTEQIRAHDIIAGAAVEIAEDSLPDDHEREFEGKNQETVLDRFVMVLGAPLTLFSELSPKSSWVSPLIIVLLCSVLQGLVTMNMTDIDGWYENQLETTYHTLPDWKKRQLDKRTDSEKRTSKKMQFFMMKASLFVMPWIKTGVSLGFFSVFVFLCSAICKGHRSYSMSLNLVSHALLLDGWRHLAMAVVATGTGLVQVSPNLSKLVEQEAAPLLYALLSWVDPFSLAFFFLIFVGLVKTLKVKRRLLAAILVFLVLSAGVGATVGLVFAANKAKSMSMKG